MRLTTVHELEVNALIPEAARVANKAVPKWEYSADLRYEWDRVFFAEMNRLTIAAGLRVPFKGEN
jgi:hypothetical protein